jgi:ribosomal protein S18 acetylase RimI-like enzyme
VNAYRIATLDPSLDTRSFRCGQPALDLYVHRYARQDVRRNLARVFAATLDAEPARLAGFYSLSAGSIACDVLPQVLARKLPRYPVPIALLGRLAVSLDFQGQGLGSILLADACQRVSEASSVLAVAGLVVDAKDETAVSFYSHFGFITLPGQTRRLLLPFNQFQ